MCPEIGCPTGNMTVSGVERDPENGEYIFYVKFSRANVYVKLATFYDLVNIKFTVFEYI